MVKIENFNTGPKANPDVININLDPCLLYTSDAADE